MKPALLCKECKYISRSNNRKNNSKWQRKAKKLLKAFKIEIKQDGCAVCGYNKCNSALHLHHMSGEKVKKIKAIATVSRLKKEIFDSNLVVLCSNCHIEIHNGLKDEMTLVSKILTCE